MVSQSNLAYKTQQSTTGTFSIDVGGFADLFMITTYADTSHGLLGDLKDRDRAVLHKSAMIGDDFFLVDPRTYLARSCRTLEKGNESVSRKKMVSRLRRLESRLIWRHIFNDLMRFFLVLSWRLNPFICTTNALRCHV